MDKILINGESYVKENAYNPEVHEIENDEGKPHVLNTIDCLIKMGYTILRYANKTANGPDIHVMRDDLVFTVEVKRARAMSRSMAVHPVEENRKNDDLISIEFPSGYVLIEPMKDYLKACAPSGSRSFFGVY